jgi:hypothetical protein
VRHLLDPKANKSQAPKDFAAALEHESTSLREAQRGLELLTLWDADTSTYMATAHKRWPQSKLFEGGA